MQTMILLLTNCGKSENKLHYSKNSPMFDSLQAHLIEELGICPVIKKDLQPSTGWFSGRILACHAGSPGSIPS